MKAHQRSQVMLHSFIRRLDGCIAQALGPRVAPKTLQLRFECLGFKAEGYDSPPQDIMEKTTHKEHGSYYSGFRDKALLGSCWTLPFCHFMHLLLSRSSWSRHLALDGGDSPAPKSKANLLVLSRE